MHREAVLAFYRSMEIKEGHHMEQKLQQKQSNSICQTWWRDRIVLHKIITYKVNEQENLKSF